MLCAENTDLNVGDQISSFLENVFPLCELLHSIYRLHINRRYSIQEPACLVLSSGNSHTVVQLIFHRNIEEILASLDGSGNGRRNHLTVPLILKNKLRLKQPTLPRTLLQF